LEDHHGSGREDAWVSSQLKVFREIAPARRASIKELLGMERPYVETMSGGRHYFSRKDLEAASSLLSPRLLESRIFPIIFSRGELEDAYVLRDAESAEAFRTLIGVKRVERLATGEYYAYKSLVIHFLSLYSSLGVITP